MNTTRASAAITVQRYQPAAYDTPVEEPVLSRIHVEETFSGDIEASAAAEFLQPAATDGSASFVGFERVDGTLSGKRGSFRSRTPAPSPGRWYPASSS